MKLHWPRGRYNGRPITGVSIKAMVDLSWWNWIPMVSWNCGQPVVFWLCFSLRCETVYHFSR